MQVSLGGARLRWRHEFRTRQIGFQELVGHNQPARGVAIKQMMAASEPEVARFTQRCAPSPAL
jgi:hypothetical protein